jgi:hypothetical protein
LERTISGGFAAEVAMKAVENLGPLPVPYAPRLKDEDASPRSHRRGGDGNVRIIGVY